jgi:hypothetical protein
MTTGWSVPIVLYLLAPDTDTPTLTVLDVRTGGVDREAALRGSSGCLVGERAALSDPITGALFETTGFSLALCSSIFDPSALTIASSVSFGMPISSHPSSIVEALETRVAAALGATVGSSSHVGAWTVVGSSQPLKCRCCKGSGSETEAEGCTEAEEGVVETGGERVG